MNGSNKLSSPKEEKVEELPMKTPFADFFGNVVANEEKEKEEDCGPIKKKKKRSIEEMLFDDIKDQATIGNDGKQELCDPEEKECEEEEKEDEKQCYEEEESNRNSPDPEMGEQLQSCVLCGKEAFWACDSGKYDTDKNDDILHDWKEMKRMLMSDKKGEQEKKDCEDGQENKNTEDEEDKKDSEEQEEEKKNTESEQEKKDSEHQKEEKDSEDVQDKKDSEDQEEEKEEKDSGDEEEEKDSEHQKEEKDSEHQKEEKDSDDEEDKKNTEAEEDDEEEKKRKEEEEKKKREEEKIALSLLRKDFMSLVFMLGRMEKMSFCDAHRVKWEKKIKEEEEKGLQMAIDAGSMKVSESATISTSIKEGTNECGMSKEEEENRWIELKARYKKLIEFKEPSTSNQDEIL